MAIEQVTSTPPPFGATSWHKPLNAFLDTIKEKANELASQVNTHDDTLVSHGADIENISLMLDTATIGYTALHNKGKLRKAMAALKTRNRNCIPFDQGDAVQIIPPDDSTHVAASAKVVSGTFIDFDGEIYSMPEMSISVAQISDYGTHNLFIIKKILENNSIEFDLALSKFNSLTGTASEVKLCSFDVFKNTSKSDLIDIDATSFKWYAFNREKSITLADDSWGAAETIIVEHYIGYIPNKIKFYGVDTYNHRFEPINIKYTLTNKKMYLRKPTTTRVDHSTEGEDGSIIPHDGDTYIIPIDNAYNIAITTVQNGTALIENTDYTLSTDSKTITWTANAPNEAVLVDYDYTISNIVGIGHFVEGQDGTIVPTNGEAYTIQILNPYNIQIFNSNTGALLVEGQGQDYTLSNAASVVVSWHQSASDPVYISYDYDIALTPGSNTTLYIKLEAE